MARSKVHPTRVQGRPAYDFACECGADSETPVATPAEADAQREQHMRTEHGERR